MNILGCSDDRWRNRCARDSTTIPLIDVDAPTSVSTAFAVGLGQKNFRADRSIIFGPRIVFERSAVTGHRRGGDAMRSGWRSKLDEARGEIEFFDRFCIDQRNQR